MKRIVSAEEMKKCDSRMIHEIGVPSMVLMERAADSCVRETLARCPGLSTKSRILSVCGSGNNGGDGFAAARICFVKGFQSEIWLVGNPDHMTEETQIQCEICRRLGIRIFTDDVPDPGKYDVIFDAIFGIGLSREVGGRYLKAIQAVNSARKETGTFVTAVDIPSGIAANTGEVMGEAVRADLTVSMQFLKPGLLLHPGTEYTGEAIAAEIGIQEIPSSHPILMPEREDLKRLLPKRSSFGNKGTFGKVLLVAGAKNMAGASMLAAKAALRSGAGMVKLLTVEDNRSIIQETLPEVMLSTYESSGEAVKALEEDLKWCTAVAAGSGMGNTERTFEIVRWLLENCKKPLILDADALNSLDGREELLDTRSSELIITPHMGEMSRLSGIPMSELKRDPISHARAFAAGHNLTCVLKDARTVTACADGTCYVNVFGNDGMATAGSGDTLTGITASLTAQGAGAHTAVLLHAAAGDCAAGRQGRAAMTAGDIITSLAELYRECGQ